MKRRFRKCRDLKNIFLCSSKEEEIKLLAEQKDSLESSLSEKEEALRSAETRLSEAESASSEAQGKMEELRQELERTAQEKEAEKVDLDQRWSEAYYAVAAQLEEQQAAAAGWKEEAERLGEAVKELEGSVEELKKKVREKLTCMVLDCSLR